VKTAFPTAATIHEGVEMARRTGAKSVISIGNGAVGDVAKGIRALMESGAKTVAENDKINARLSTATTNEVSYPHIAVSTTLSPTPSLPGWVCLHHEEDVFTRRSCNEPQVRAIELI
jgi:alcohol dehydrogenase class IV